VAKFSHLGCIHTDMSTSTACIEVA